MCSNRPGPNEDWNVTEERGEMRLTDIKPTLTTALYYEKKYLRLPKTLTTNAQTILQRKKENNICKKLCRNVWISHQQGLVWF